MVIYIKLKSITGDEIISGYDFLTALELFYLTSVLLHFFLFRFSY